MAFGNYSNNTAKKTGPYDPTVYSYRFNNSMSSVDQTALICQLWNKTFCIKICPKNADSPADQPTFDTKNGISIYLNHAKARVLATVLREFISDPVGHDNSGVNSGSSIITFSSGKDFQSKFPLVIIRKVDESGTITSSFAYEVKGDYHYSISGFSENSNGNFDKKFYPMLELEELLTALEEYYKAETRAIAYSVMDELKYNDYRMTTRLMRIGEKLGVEMSLSSNGSQRSSSSSYFSKNGNDTSGNDYGPTGVDAYISATLDDIE